MKSAPPFRVRLTGGTAEIEAFAEILRTQYASQPDVRHKSSRRAELRCDVPQEHATAVMLMIRGGT